MLRGKGTKVLNAKDKTYDLYTKYKPISVSGKPKPSKAPLKSISWLTIKAYFCSSNRLVANPALTNSILETENKTS